MSIANSIHHSNEIYNYFKQLKLGLFLSDIYIRHLMTIVLSVFISGYRGKTIDFAKAGFHHRTTISHFLNHGKWDSSRLEKVLKANVIRVIY